MAKGVDFESLVTRHYQPFINLPSASPGMKQMPATSPSRRSASGRPKATNYAMKQK
jgi:hypothetical protein